MNPQALFLFASVRRWLAALVILLVALTLILLFFPGDLLRGPVNRYVSGQLGRHFEITRRLAVKLGPTTTAQLEGVELANPDWAKDPFLLRAKAARFEIKV